MRVGLIGATGLVGSAFLKILEERKFPVEVLYPFASKSSAGSKIQFNNTDWTVEEISPEHLKSLDLLFVATGEDISEIWSPRAIEAGVPVIDNSSAFRMKESIPLVVPEVNSHLISRDNLLYANPNCSTIQLVVALNALKKAGTLNDIIVSSYQAVSGAGRDALKELEQGVHSENSVFPEAIAFNVIPQIGSFGEGAFCSEEHKVMRETKKILDLKNTFVSAHTVRVPVKNGHAESVWVTFENELKKSQIEEALSQQEGLTYLKDPNSFHTPLQTSGTDEVFVSRLRQDLDNPKRWIFWIVADNIRKGAATNAIQIAEKYFSL